MAPQKLAKVETFNGQERDSFTLPGQSAPTYRLAEVQPESATVVLLNADGKTGTHHGASKSSDGHDGTTARKSRAFDG